MQLLYVLTYTIRVEYYCRLFIYLFDGVSNVSGKSDPKDINPFCALFANELG